MVHVSLETKVTFNLERSLLNAFGTPSKLAVSARAMYLERSVKDMFLLNAHVSCQSLYEQMHKVPLISYDTEATQKQKECRKLLLQVLGKSN